MWEVKLHNSFVAGLNDSDFIVDDEKLKGPEDDALYKWLEDILCGKNHLGKNKESWIDKHGSEVEGAKSYKNANGWHYHCGPTISAAGTAFTSAVLERNFRGQRTNEVAHYIKLPKTLIVIGYSRKHIPFLNDGTQSSAKQRHPFASRLGTPRNSAVYEVPVPPTTPPEGE